MGPRDRRERDRLETRELILNAARDLFATDGYDAVTMRQIADRIEYTPTAIYHHFASKEELLTELCHTDFQKLAVYFQQAAHIADPLTRAWMIGQHYINFAAEHPNHYRFMFMTVRPRVEHSPEYLAETRGNPQRNAYEFLRQCCAQAIETERLRPEFSDADQVAQILWAGLHGLISLPIVKVNDDWITFADLRETSRLQREALYRGMLRDSSELDSIVAGVGSASRARRAKARTR